MNQNKPNISLQDLLKWGISNATAKEDCTTTNPNLEKIDPKWIDIVLGKPDVVRMKENMTTILNSDLSLEERLLAFDDLELLVESIDNANDLKACQLWKPLLQLLNDPLPDIRKFAAWVISTSIQNNPTATKHFVEMNGMQVYIQRSLVETDSQVIGKLINIASGLVNLSSQYIPLLHSHGVLKHFFSYLLIHPAHPCASKLFHLFTTIFATLNDMNSDQQHHGLISVIVTHVLLTKLIDIHLSSSLLNSNSSSSIEECLIFILTCKDHIQPPLTKETFQSLFSRIQSMDIDEELKEQIQHLAEN